MGTRRISARAVIAISVVHLFLSLSLSNNTLPED